MRKPHDVSKKAREWAKHLRPEGKRMANKSHRKNVKANLKKEYAE